MLELSRIENSCDNYGQLVNKNPYDIVKSVRSVVKMLEVKARSKNVKMLVETQYDGFDAGQVLRNLLVIADESRIRQVSVNLLANALKFTDSGSITTLIKIAKLHTMNVMPALLLRLLTLDAASARKICRNCLFRSAKWVVCSAVNVSRVPDSGWRSAQSLSTPWAERCRPRQSSALAPHSPSHWMSKCKRVHSSQFCRPSRRHATRP